jgi:hypothetical protein
MRLSFGLLLLLPGAMGCARTTLDSGKKAPDASTEQAPAKSAEKAPALPDSADAKPAQPGVAAPEPDYIKVQHCLIAFKGSLPKPTVTRTKDEAKALAYDILERARKGENFDALVKQYTDDSPPGIYAMSNFGKATKPDYYARNRMVPAFGDTGFPLQVGQYGIADFDAKKSPYGWHIVKRIE